MAQHHEGVDQQQVNLAARRVLLDALDALEGHRDALVLVGAQAVYEHVGAAELGVAAFTSDSDVGVDPDKIGDEPLIDQAMIAADFTRTNPNPGQRDQPGIWWKRQIVDGQDLSIEVDLLVPFETSSGGRQVRGARIPPHDKGAMHRVAGLSVAMVDHDVRTLTSLEPAADSRSIAIKVAGIPALLVAKSFKLGERLRNDPGRLNAKDASDVVGLMTASPAAVVADTLARFRDDTTVGPTVRLSLEYLGELFGRNESPGISLAIEALTNVRDPQEIQFLMTSYIAALPRP